MSYKIVAAIQTGATVTYTYSATAGLGIVIATYKAIVSLVVRPVVFTAT
jgi:hypothetical protein